MRRVFAPNAATTTAHDLVAASQRLLHAVAHDHRTDDLFSSLASLDEGVLDFLRRDPHAGKAFWLNVYGALVADGGADASRRVAGTRVDADTLLHGVLRGSKWKYGFGYLPDPLPGRFVRRHGLDGCDERVHFAALAAEHAPRLGGTFTAVAVDAELAEVTTTYLDGTVGYDPAVGVARVPGAFFWHRGDFGGRDGVRRFLVEHGALPADADPRFSYASPDPDVEPESEARRRREPRQ